MNTAPQKERKENHTIDFLKLFFALCIVGIHTDLVKIFPSEHTQWYVMQVVFRMGVPFFFSLFSIDNCHFQYKCNCR